VPISPEFTLHFTAPDEAFSISEELRDARFRGKTAVGSPLPADEALP